jgi:branched-chain amino acid transport system ATP-binding protein
MALLSVEGIHKSFGGNRVLQGVSFRVEEGETIGIVGPNGSGKTTLINILSGVLRPDRGVVVFSGENISHWRAYRRARAGIGRTYQITRLFANLTAAENVMIPLYYGAGEKLGEDRIDEILELVGLYHKKHNYASDLSLAQRKRLELARALALRPKLLLLDEVFAGLNPVAVQEVVQLLQKLRQELGLTLIIVEHVLKALSRLAGRVLVLAEGKLIFEGSYEDMVRDERVIKAYLGERYGETA